MKIAIVYDRVTKMGGAERILTALHEIWPEAPLYTAVHLEHGARWAKGWRVITSFLQKIPLVASHHEFYPWATPLAFETFTFDEFDVVLSVTSAEAKSIITKPSTLHICYCLTPTRYLWSGYEEYKKERLVPLLKPLGFWAYEKFTPILRSWDKSCAYRPDYYIAISDHVKKRIKKYYNQECQIVIYPPVDTKLFVPPRVPSEGYYLLVSRMVHYKRIDIVIEAFNQLGWPLVVIGDGRNRQELIRYAQGNIRVISDYLTDHELVGYYQKCRAFVFAGNEDFGLVAAEAQACGKPVIAYRRSGIAEIVRDGKTGILYDDQTINSLKTALMIFQNKKFSPEVCRRNSERFSLGSFKKQILKKVEYLDSEYRSL